MESISLYNDYLDRTASEQNGVTTIEKYNRYSKLGELRLMDYLSGDVEGTKPPEPYNVQKLKDWFTIFITTDSKQVQNGTSPRPGNYYRFESLKIIGSYLDENDCGEAEVVHKANTPITLLDSQMFDKRLITDIKSLRPSARKPYAKMVGQTFVYAPEDLGSVILEYARNPVFGEVKTKIDPVYNDLVPDPATSIPYEWPEYARNILLYFIVQQFPIGTREKALVEQNELAGKGARG